MAKKPKEKRSMGCLLPTLLFGLFILAGWFVETSMFDELAAPDYLSPDDKQAWLDQREAEREARRQDRNDDKQRHRIMLATKAAVRNVYLDASDIEVVVHRENKTYYSIASFQGVNSFGGPAPTSVRCNWVYNETADEWIILDMID
jgi:hypothetical protein